MLKIVRFKSSTVVFLGGKLYTTTASANCQSFIVMKGVKYFETKREVLRTAGFTNFPAKPRRIRLKAKSTSYTPFSMCA